MTGISQRIFGNGNQQSTQIFNRPMDMVDICADKIGLVLKTISGINFLQVSQPDLKPPKIDEKNEKNNIDAAISYDIEMTYALWDEITQTIGLDSTGGVANDYNKAAFILNQIYLAKFRGNFPAFKVHAITIYCQNVNATSDEAFLLIHLIHYMYLSCHVGVRP